jgi:putative hydrolase of the HAD superfamily
LAWIGIATEFFIQLHCLAGSQAPIFMKMVTELSGFRPAQLLLIDDTPANVLAARNLGWNAVEWTKSSTLAEQISKLQMAVRYIW